MTHKLNKEFDVERERVKIFLRMGMTFLMLFAFFFLFFIAKKFRYLSEANLNRIIQSGKMQKGKVYYSTKRYSKFLLYFVIDAIVNMPFT